jgi:hypothetical protein
MINERESVWKKAVMAWFKVLSQHLPGRTNEYDENVNQVASLRADIWTQGLPNKKWEY